MDLPDLLPDMPDISDEDIEHIQAIHSAAAAHDVQQFRPLLQTRDDANVMQPTDGRSPLHTAIASSKPDRSVTNGNDHNDSDESEEEAKAAATVKYLLLNGAIWNALDSAGETPGCVALKMGNIKLYDMMVDAGVRAELLFNSLAGYEKLEDDEEEDGEEAEEAVEEDRPVNSENYFGSDLKITDTKILDSDLNGVMMEWERPIMELTALLLLPAKGLRVLNVGHGMGIIDEYFQSHEPSAHHIIEAHPDVLAKMKTDGWAAKSGVVIHEGTWQSVVPKLLEQGIEFDAIYFDTFAEPYSALKLFFSEHIPSLLSQLGEGDDGKGGRWSFFHGLGADRQICYDVYTKVVEIDMAEIGFDTEWTDVEVADLTAQGEWTGVRRPYFAVAKYRLPISRWMD